MKRFAKRTSLVLALAMAGFLTAGPSLAEKGGNSGHSKGNSGKGGDKSEQHENKGGHHGQPQQFESRHGTMVNDYYSKRYAKGCPPGLAKKNNGCQPPGQAKKWHMGQALPGNVRYYSVPQPLVQQLGQPPAGYRYVRVDSDILLMELIGRKVVSAIVNFGRG
jgi:Ni/Co efflux regulator RcnB